MRLFFATSALFLAAFSGTSIADGTTYTIEDYNGSLPIWGTSWSAGGSAINGYYPSFYTGFAPRIATPSRIHIRLARGNQTRVSTLLDEETLRDYLFDLVKRYRFYAVATSGSRPLLNVRPDASRTARVIPQLASFNRIIESDAYGILSFVEGRGASASAEEIYEKSLAVVSALNPGRIFNIRLDLSNAFRKSRAQIASLVGSSDPAAVFTLKSTSTVIALDNLVPGRVNVTEKPSAELLAELAALGRAAVDSSVSDDSFVLLARDLFVKATGSKYAFKTLRSGRFVPALDCATASSCTLCYPEFTTVYPTGTVMETTRDEFGNSVNQFSTPGLWSFVSRGARTVDNIREEPYYGWIPKMDYEAIGNGFHNPAVRMGITSTARQQLNLGATHDTFWSVKRGGVSHGCSRLPVGHVWEMRHIFPVADAKMTQVNYFGSDPHDFDVYDVDGDGNAEVIGVEYLISYGLRETTGLGSREGTGLEIGREHKLAFYENLYGERNVFRQTSDGQYLFNSPTVSLISYLDRMDKRIDARQKLEGEYPLYEQTYERDKVQLYVPITMSGLESPGMGPLSKRIVRLLGRVRGCAPSADKQSCGEADFDREAASILSESGASR